MWQVGVLVVDVLKLCVHGGVGSGCIVCAWWVWVCSLWLPTARCRNHRSMTTGGEGGS